MPARVSNYIMKEYYCYQSPSTLPHDCWSSVSELAVFLLFVTHLFSSSSFDDTRSRFAQQNQNTPRPLSCNDSLLQM